MGERPSKRQRMSPPKNASAPFHRVNSPRLVASISEVDSDDSESDQDLSDDNADSSEPGEDEDGLTFPKDKQVKSHHAVEPRKRFEKSGPHDVVDGFRLQVHELLRSVTSKITRESSSLQELLRRIKSSIETAQNVGPVQAAQATKHFARNKIAVPFPNPPPAPEANHQCAYAKPDRIDVLGEWTLDTAIKSDYPVEIDFAVQMPAQVFTAKDYLDYRYFHKRAFYLATLTEAISTSFKDEADLKYALLDDNPLLPILVIRLMEGNKAATLNGQSFIIRVLPHARTAPFPSDKLQLQHSCVRSLKPSPTLYYNSSLSQDVARLSVHCLLEHARDVCDNFSDACKLGCIWLKQRGYHSALSGGGFGRLEWSLLLALRLTNSKPFKMSNLLPTLDALQLFKAALRTLATQDFVEKPVRPSSDGLQSPANAHVPMFFSEDFNSNILFRMTLWSYTRLRTDAQTTIRALNRNASDSFGGCFIYRVEEMPMRYDYIAKVPAGAGFKTKMPDSDKPQQLSKSEELYNVIQRGLHDRLKELYISIPRTSPWNVARSHETRGQQAAYLLCMTIEPSLISRRVDRGPSTESTDQLAKFKQLWGGKSELRRFKDGSIREAVAWTSNNPRELLSEIVAYLLGLHFSAALAKETNIVGNDIRHIKAAVDTDLASFDPIMTAYQTLEHDIRSLDDMPLSVRQIRPASSVLSCTSLPSPTSAQSEVAQSIDVTVQYEGSSRWPDELSAIQMTKVAFLLKMAESLEKAGALSAQVGLENESSQILNRAFVVIKYHGDIAFHIRIHHDREQALLERELKNRSLSPAEREMNAAALLSHKIIFEKRPAHVGAMQILVRRHPALSPSTRLLKAWFNAHLLQPHVSSELIELIAAQAFLIPFPWSAPTSAMTGFLRSLLFLSRWDWQREPLFVNFDPDQNKEAQQAVQTRFEAWRKIDPAMNRVVLFAATSYDTDGTSWTEYNPNNAVANRMTNLAKAATSLVLRDGMQLDAEKLFKPSMKDYDFIINLKPTQRSKETLAHESKTRRLPTSSDAGVLFFQELRGLYAETAMFFADLTNVSVIAGVWQPSTNSRKWKAGLPFSTVVDAGSGGQTAINKAATLAEIARVGGSLIDSITSRG